MTDTITVQTPALEKEEPAAVATQRPRRESEDSNPENASPEIEFKPIVSLPLVEVRTLEEEESELLKIRAKLYRYETSEDPPEWKERGLGDVKFLQNPETSAVRILMRREKTLKICANHNVTPTMSLNQHANNEKAFVWSTVCDFSDGEPRPETFCIRFGSVENAQKFRKAFDEAKSAAASIKNLYDSLNTMALNDESSSDSESDADDKEKETADPSDEKGEQKVATPAAKSNEDLGNESKENEAPEVDAVTNRDAE